MKKYRHVFADMDGTLTRSRTVISEKNRDALLDFTSMRDGHIVVVSGATTEQIQKQMGALRDYQILAQNGNEAWSYEDLLWRNELNWIEKYSVLQWCFEFIHTDAAPVRWGIHQEKVLDLVQDRGCQISFSVLGHNAPLEEKEAFDPDHAKRVKMLKEFPFETYGGDTLEVKIGGTTCFDFYKKGSNKGLNVHQFIERMGWEDEDCVYIGDALWPGGNDESVLGVIDTIPVKSPEELPAVLNKIQP